VDHGVFEVYGKILLNRKNIKTAQKLRNSLFGAGVSSFLPSRGGVNITLIELTLLLRGHFFLQKCSFKTLIFIQFRLLQKSLKKWGSPFHLVNFKIAKKLVGTSELSEHLTVVSLSKTR